MNTYQQQAQAVTASRRKAGRYPTPEQKRAGRKIATQGAAAMTRDELIALSTSPWAAPSQRREYAALAASVNWR